MRPNIQCDSTGCWCRDEGYHEKWIPSLDAMQTVDEVVSGNNLPTLDNVRVFQYRATPCK